MMTSSTLAVAAAVALALPAAGALAQTTETPAASSTPPAERTIGPERTDDAERAAGHRGDPGPHRAAPDREPGRNVGGDTFAPDSNPGASDAHRRDPDNPATPEGPRSPPTGDASGGDRRTDAGPRLIAQAWFGDPDFRSIFAYPHSVGVADVRRINDAAGGDLQPPARRLHGAHPPPPPIETSSASQSSNVASVAERGRRASPATRLVSTPFDVRGARNGAAAPATSGVERFKPRQ